MKAASTSMGQTSFTTFLVNFSFIYFDTPCASRDTSSCVFVADRLYVGLRSNKVVDRFLLSIRRGITGKTIEECGGMKEREKERKEKEKEV